MQYAPTTQLLLTPADSVVSYLWLEIGSPTYNLILIPHSLTPTP